jgi:CubicO group peptidase (beta-lactamase class C family)
MQRLLWALLAASLISCSSKESATPAPADAAVDAAVDVSLDDPEIPERFAAFAKAFDDERKTLNARGAAVAILERGEVTFARGFGARDTAGTPVRARTSFRIGSVTKVFTALAVLQLVDAGKVSLTAKATSLVPTLSFNDPELASLGVRQLLSQQSGINDFLTVNAPASQKTDAALATFLTGSGARTRGYFMNPPGIFWNYSNPNYYIAGLVAERASGVPYRELMATRVFAPLGMNRTFFLGSEVIDDADFAVGVSKTDGKDVDIAPDSYDNAWARPAGYAYSNVLDLARFVRFLHVGDAAVLTDARRAELQAPAINMLTAGSTQHYGYGVFIYDGVDLGKDKYVATKVVAHGGDINGFAADFYYVPATGFGIVMLASADGAHFSDSVALAMESFAGLPAPSTPPDLHVDPATFDRFVGDYTDARNAGRIKITRAGDDLQIAMPDVEAAGLPYSPKLRPVSPGNFVLSIQGTQLLVTFVDDGGKTAWFRTRAFVGKRDATTTAAPMIVDGQRLARELRDLPRAPWPLTRL